MKIIYQCLVGSKMHGLSTPSSDEDVRYITLPSLRSIISPFQNEAIKVRSSQGDDEESWTLSHFVKHLCQGNPTVYEVIKTDHYNKTLPHAEVIRSLMPFCFDGRKVLLAHCGYAKAQIKRYLIKADYDLSVHFGFFTQNQKLLGIPKFEFENGKLKNNEVWEENNLRRIPKSVVAGYRVIAQGKQLLTTGDFCPVVSNYSQELHDKLMDIKLMDANSINWEFVKKHLEGVEEGIKELKAIYDNLPVETQTHTPNLDKIEDVLCGIYGI